MQSTESFNQGLPDTDMPTSGYLYVDTDTAAASFASNIARLSEA